MTYAYDHRKKARKQQKRLVKAVREQLKGPALKEAREKEVYASIHKTIEKIKPKEEKDEARRN